MMQIPPFNKVACRGWPAELKGMARILLARSTHQEYTTQKIW